MNPVLEVNDLNAFYSVGGSILGKKRRQVLFDVSFAMEEGEILGLVGESGCGKTTLSRCILGLHRDREGEIIHHSRQPQMIFQDPASSLNPAWTVERLLEEPLLLAGERSGDKRRAAAQEMICRVGLDEKFLTRKPGELSGGQRQRIAIALAVIRRPRLVIADEPVSALDVTVQAQILELLTNLQQEFGLSYLFISHDMDVIYQLCHRVMVMRNGRIVELGTREQVFDHPEHDYTRQLLAVSESPLFQDNK